MCNRTIGTNLSIQAIYLSVDMKIGHISIWDGATVGRRIHYITRSIVMGHLIGVMVHNTGCDLFIYIFFIFTHFYYTFSD